ncbi:TauD/TfdA family dioxygenase [Streptomyces brevispora]|uniref:L-asparagine oxygenase n=1 Tax=Streptomyces brevispora TaxID=887462 RepID=A0A561V5C2_9ACTN|nr:TauD/TfdA family dioxygenase [Streptomyces brevispora]TWG06830.1 L-asparagine oxygenase [Streptomyces brevispora]WSC12302.1 TauD/TfdA family dioxygenase [Streptomyces brevispora]
MTQTSVETTLSPAALVLTGPEREVVGELADHLAKTGPAATDDLDWIRAVRNASAGLPRRLLAELRAFRHDAGPDGVLLIRNLPVAPADGTRLPSTPSHAGSVERTASTAAAVVTAAMLQLGEVIAYRNEKSGALVQNVVPVPGQESQQSNAGSELLEMHTENAFHNNRPDYIGLLCVREDPSGEARLCTASVRRALPLLSERARRVLSEDRFLTEAPPSFEIREGAAPAHAILPGAPEDPNVLVDFHATHPLDNEAREAMAELRDVLIRVTSALALTPGDLAVVDNRLAVHGRSSFSPRYDGTDRWLHRVYASLDNRRTRPLRHAAGAVLG